MNRRLFVTIFLLALLSSFSIWSAEAQGPQPVDSPTLTPTLAPPDDSSESQPAPSPKRTTQDNQQSTSSSAVLETLTVPTDGTLVQTSFDLLDGVVYIIRVSGVYKWGNCDPFHCPNGGPDYIRWGDAEYLTDDNWQSFSDPFWSEFVYLEVNGSDPDFGPFNPDHIYSIQITGNGQPATFRFHDCASCYGDNAGQVTAQVAVLRPSPSVEQRDVVFVRGLGSEGMCDGANEWAKDYLSSELGRSFFGNAVIGKYLNFNYAGGGSYDCPRPASQPNPAYTKAHTCDGVVKAADELKALINEQFTAKVTLLGHSMGGLVSAYLVASDPEWARSHIASVVTFDSPLKGLPGIAQAIAFYFGCDPLNAPSMQDLLDTSQVVSTASSAATIVPLYPFDATRLLGPVPVNFGIDRERTRLDSARPFHLINRCGSPFGPGEPNCEPPRSIDDDHSQAWGRRFDGGSQDKAFLVGCAVIVADDCTFLTAPVNQDASTQTQVEVSSGVTRIRFTSSFGSIVRMTLVSPDGTIYGPDGAGPVAAYAADAVSEVYEIANPAPGTWTIKLFGVEVAPEGEEVSLSVLVLESSGPEFQAPPVADAGGPYTGEVGNAVTFNGIGSFDPDGRIALYEWDFESDGILDFSSPAPTASHIYPTAFSGAVTLRVTDNEGFTGANGAQVNVESAVNEPPILTVPGQLNVQYSDLLSFNVSATDPDDTSSSLVFSAAGMQSGLSLTDNGNGTATVAGIVQAAPGNYTAEITVTDPDGLTDTETVPIVVTQEDARAIYTGALFASTSGATSNMANVTLAATIQDITAADPAGDPNPGDIRNASVTFVNRDNGNATLCTATVGLVNPADTKTGTATCTWTANPGNADSISVRVGVVVNNYYTRNSTDDDTIVTVSKPLVSNFITGGGYIVLSNSAGLKAGDADSKNNFGFNVKYNKSGTNLQGRINIIVRRTESDGLHVYQIKGNVMTSLAVQLSPGTATFNGKASIQDVTNPLVPVSVDGNATLQVTMDDNGEPGSSDTIGITVWNKSGGLWFASKWDGTRTVEQLLDGGNLVVR